MTTVTCTEVSAGGYDLIGDIHGYNEPLQRLLEELGYQNKNGCYRHDNRTAVFLGDFIDRGPGQWETLQIVMPMVRSDAALAVMGNHEFNALAYHTPHPDTGEPLRKWSKKNKYQHKAFLDQVTGAKRDAALAFFWELPLWLEIDAGDGKRLRVVHACWHEPFMDLCAPLLNDRRITKELLVKASNPDRDEYNALETLLKGHEMTLPDGLTFKDKGGTVRTEVRTQWWKSRATKYHQVTLPRNVLKKGSKAYDCDLPEQLKNAMPGYPEDAPPVVLGHYWEGGAPRPMDARHPAGEQGKIVCVDYSVAKAGHLVAYRWCGEQLLHAAKFHAVKARP